MPSVAEESAGPRRGARARGIPGFLSVLLLAASLPVPAFALRIVPGSLSVSRSVDSGVTWFNVSPGDTVKINDYIRVIVTLENNTGWLGNLYADPGPPPPIPNSPNPVIVNPPMDFAPQNNGMMDQGVHGEWPGQYWMWPVLGGTCPGSACPNDLYPARGDSPVSLIANESITSFHYNGKFLNTVEAYDTATDTWSAKAPMPTARGRVGVASVGGKFYVIGGRNDGGVLATNEMYDPATDAWIPRAPMPTAREGLAVVAANGKIYAIGGVGTGGAVYAIVEEYDPGSNTWAVGKAPMPTARYGAAAAMVNVAGNDTIYVMGGYTGQPFITPGLLDVVEAYDAGADSWTTVSPLPMDSNGLAWRIDMAAATDGTNIFTAGGWDYVMPPYDYATYDPASDFWNPGWNMANYPRTRLAMVYVGSVNRYYAVGGAPDSLALPWFGIVDPMASQSGNNEYYDPGADWWTPVADMLTPRTWLGAAAANVAGTDYVFAIGGYTGFRYADVTGVGDPNNTARVAWTFQCRTEWCGLDFSVFASQLDDGNAGLGITSEGSYFDCNSCCIGCVFGDGTLGTIFTSEWGGTLCIKSPLESGAHAEVVATGTRPPGVAYIGDAIRVFVSVTNTGAATTLNPGDACNAYHPNSSKGTQVCLMPLDPQGFCAALSTQPASPVLPDGINLFENKTYTWDFAVAGQNFYNGFKACSVGSWGSGSAYWDVVIQGAKSEAATLYVEAAPLRITATAWVDPDGPLGPEPKVPMRDIGGGVGGYYYYMSRDSVEATFIYTNTSTVYSFDIEPDIAVGGFDPTSFEMIAGPTPAGTLMLLPGNSATVVWAFTRTPGGILDTCQGLTYGMDFTSAVRGVAATLSVEIKDVPFHPLDACFGGCPPNSRNLTFDLPGTAPVGSAFLVNLYARNPDGRPFVLDPGAAYYAAVTPMGGGVTLMSSPTAPPTTWLGGQTKTLSWQYSADSPGQVCFETGIDYSSGSPPCLVACREGVPYCDNTAPYPLGCMFCVIPGAFSVTDFTAGPNTSCDDSGQVVLLKMGVKNTSSVFCAVVTRFCDFNYPDAFPTGFANPYSKAPPPYAPVVSPFPALPFTVQPDTVQVVTWYMDAACPPTPGGVLNFSCFSKTYRMVEGYTVNCKSGVTINPADGDNWGGAVPTVTITQPAYLSCSIWTDNFEYSVGQMITVYFSVSNEGGDDLTSFGVGAWPTLFLGATLGPAAGPVPPAPAGYPGGNACLSTPPFVSNQTFTWQFLATNRGKVYFTATGMGWDAGCGTWKSTSCRTPEIGIKSSAQLACALPRITKVVTMSVSCTGCTPVSGCDRVTGSGCLNVAMDLSNFGDIQVSDVDVSLSSGTPALRACTPPGACISGSAILESRTLPPSPLGSLASGTAAWRYRPAGLGCLQVHVEAFGKDNATGTTLWCDQWTECSEIRARYPMSLALVSVPPQVAPGQEFPVQVKVCNPGDTTAALQSGEPAFQFYLAATGAKVTDEYDVVPPPPAALRPGECRTIEVIVTAHRNAGAGPVDIRVAQGTQFVAMDQDTGLSFPAIDSGGPVTTQLISLQNKLVVMGNNQTRILKQPVVLNYQIADAGRQNGKTTLRIYTLTGELVRTLVDKAAAIEEANVPWDGRNDAGQLCASGIYLARLESPSYSKVIKIAILK